MNLKGAKCKKIGQPVFQRLLKCIPVIEITYTGTWLCSMFMLQLKMLVYTKHYN